MRIGEDIIKRAEFISPFSQFVQSLELGNYVQETYINPAQTFLHDTVTNSDLLTDHTDTIMTAIHEVNVDLNIPSTYKEYIVRTSFNFWDNVNNLVASLVANIRVTSEIAKQNIVKQMLYNGYKYGMISAYEVPDPTASADNSEKYVIALNTLIDDFLTEANTRNMIYNNTTTAPTVPAVGIGTQVPYVIMFNEYLRTIEMLNALQLVFGRYEATSGNTNQDYARRLIRLQAKDFPTSVPGTNRSSVTGTNVPVQLIQNPLSINFFEMPTVGGNALYPNTPQAGSVPCAFVVEPSAIIMRSQLDVTTNFQNAATLATTNRLILRMTVSLSGFDKIACLAYTPSTTTTP